MARRSLATRRVVFGRIGWMHRYAGSVPGDEKPIGGGKYNKTEIGSEVSNFKRRGQWLYGYFETVIRRGITESGVPLKLHRIDPAASGDHIDDGRTLCVEVKATTTAGEQVILTRNEVDLKAERALFVLHSVEMIRGKPRGGRQRVLHPWRPRAQHLKPISYVYTLPG